MSAVPILDANGKPAGTVELAASVFGVTVNVPLVHQAVVRELADRRRGTHDTKGRSEVSGGGRKPWRQKKTGRARQGSIRAPQWRGGGIVFGPHPRDYTLAMPQKARRGALRVALSQKLADGAIVVVNQIALAEPKTKTLVAFLKGLGLRDSTLLVVIAPTENLTRASRNLRWLRVVKPGHLSAYELLRHRRVLFERTALEAVQEALA
jgi:large subunit ribosomal protein L4